MDGISELAKMFKERESRPYVGPRIGKVISPPPEIKVTLEDGIILDKTHLVISAHVLQNYNREYDLQGKIKFKDKNCGNTSVEHDGGYQASSHSHTVENINIDTEYVAKGTVKSTDTLKPGDKVILIPSTDEQTYFLIDKAVIL